MNKNFYTTIIRSFLFLALIASHSLCAQPPWPDKIPNYKPVQTGEHPRLLFREDDLPKLRQRAQTPEGQAILNRLRECLNGSDGKTLPTSYNPEISKIDSDGSGEFHTTAPLGTYTFSHMAGYGFLYQITGDKHYAQLGYQCFELELQGYRDRDRRYAYQHPYGALRAGPVLGWTALGYDLCYDGWDQQTRQKVCAELEKYFVSEKVNLENLTKGTMPPFSNHYGMQVGGAAMALLAINQDPGVDQDRINYLLSTSKESMIRNLTEGFGDGGFFAEGDGTGSMSSHIVFLSALQSWKNAAGIDFITPRTNAPWTTLKWIYLAIPHDGIMNFWPKRGGYPHNVWDRDDKSGSGYFAHGFGAVNQEHKPALLWFYNRHLKKIDAENGTPYDTPSPYPHFAITSFINWPWDSQEQNPAEILPLAYRDSKWGLYVFRNRWQDENDIVISVQTRDAKGYIKALTEGKLHIAAHGKKETWGRLKGDVVSWQTWPDGSGIITLDNGTSCAIDFSGKSGADGLIIMTGPGSGSGKEVKLGEQTLTLKFLPPTSAPEIDIRGEELHIGHQTITLKNKALSFSSKQY